MNRTLNVIRLQLTNRQTYIWVPLIILGSSFLVSMLVWVMLPPGATKYSGGAQAPLWYFLAVGVMALTYTFPFSQAMSLTRREYFFGTLLTAGLTSGLLAVVFVGGGFLEQATDGWGIDGYFFYLAWVWERGPASAFLTYFVVAMMLFIFGMWTALLYKRFGVTVLVSTLVGLGLALVGIGWLIGRADAWGDLFTWIGVNGSLGLTLWGVVLTAVLGGASYLTLRRTVP
ncbi:hypothetical protein ACTU3I_01865 [Microbacterium sp. RD1]|uniref:hypothetical protein n=1 Tax=Microbacterium sp. RD1 TaxID=3457313 RepID=UPI003FA542AE